MGRTLCPKCGKDFVRRALRKDAREHLPGLISVYPFRCQLCAHRKVD